MVARFCAFFRSIGTGRSRRVSSSAIERSWSIEVNTVVASTPGIIATVIINFISLLLLLVGSSTNGCTYDGTAGHAHDGSNVTTTPATGDSTDSRTEYRPERSTGISALASVGPTAAHQQHTTCQYHQYLFHNVYLIETFTLQRYKLFADNTEGIPQKVLGNSLQKKKKTRSGQRQTSLLYLQECKMLTLPWPLQQRELPQQQVPPQRERPLQQEPLPWELKTCANDESSSLSSDP